MGSGVSKKQQPQQATAAPTADPHPPPGTTTTTTAPHDTAKPHPQQQHQHPQLHPSGPGQTVTSVSHAESVTKPTPHQTPTNSNNRDPNKGNPTAASAYGYDADAFTTPALPPLRDPRLAGAATTKRTPEDPRIIDDEPVRSTPKFDKEKFKRANKEPQPGDTLTSTPHHSHSHHAPPPHHQPQAAAQEPQDSTQNFLDKDDEDFMAAILRDTEFVARDRGVF
ncbi:hypothetical protein DFJ77DRAFT_470677 [Powellomyces hirtus]|nr:hypothetical protein DFJ77DRAFT_470677 [Powellomyces hirtus]